MEFKKRTEMIRVRGRAAPWFAKCGLALEDADFWVLRDDQRLHVFEARYRGFTIDGTLRLTLTEVGEDEVDIEMVASADCDSIFAWFADPLERILNAFTRELPKGRRRKRP